MKNLIRVHCVSVVFFVALTQVNCTFKGTEYSNNERRLRRDLLRNYQKILRPVLVKKHVVVAFLELKYHSLEDVDSKQQYVRVKFGVLQYWPDYKLVWDPKLYGNITKLRLNLDDIWRPDIYQNENLEMDPKNVERHVGPVKISLERYPSRDLNKVYNYSLIKSQYPAILKGTCRTHAAGFPADYLKCDWSWGSWTTNLREIYQKFTGNITESEDAYGSKIWNYKIIQKTQWERHYEVQSELTDGKTIKAEKLLLLFRFEISRHSAFFVTSLIIPTAVIVQLNLLGMFTISDSTGTRSEKVGLGITSIVSLSVLLLVVNDLLPSSSYPVPYFSLAVAFEMVLSVVALLCSTFLISPGRNPKWLRRLTNGCGGKKDKSIGKDGPIFDDSQLQQNRAFLKNASKWHNRAVINDLVNEMNQVECSLRQALLTCTRSLETQQSMRQTGVFKAELLMFILFTMAAWSPVVLVFFAPTGDEADTSIQERAPVFTDYCSLASGRAYCN